MACSNLTATKQQVYYIVPNVTSSTCGTVTLSQSIKFIQADYQRYSDLMHASTYLAYKCSFKTKLLISTDFHGTASFLT